MASAIASLDVERITDDSSIEKNFGDTSLLPTTQPEASPRNMGKIRWTLTVAALYASTLLYGLDTTIVADVQVPIVEAFGHLDQLTWIGSAFPLGSVALILPVGVMYGLFNIKWIYVLSFALFEGGSALCGGSPGMNALIIGRVIAGIGGAGMYLGNLNFFASLTTIRERPVYVAGAGLAWGAGAILGPIIGGAFANSSATWRWAFYINLVVAALCGPVYVFSLPSIHPKPGVSTLKKIFEIDILGSFLVAAIFAMFIIPLTFAGGVWKWGDASTIACLVLCGALVAIFIVQQGFSILTTPEQRIFPVDLLHSRTLILLFISTASTSANLFIPIYYIPLYFQFTHGDDSLQAAVRLLPFVLIGVFTTMLSGGIMPKFGYYMPWYVLSGVAGTLGGALMHSVKITTSTGTVYGYSIPVAIGAGASLQIGYSVAQAVLPAHKIPAAIRFMNMAQLGGTTIALTIAGRVFQTFAFRNVKQALAGLGFSDAEVGAAISGTQAALLSKLSPQVRDDVLEGVVKAIAKAYILVSVGGATTLICSFFMKRERLFTNANAAAEITEEK